MSDLSIKSGVLNNSRFENCSITIEYMSSAEISIDRLTPMEESTFCYHKINTLAIYYYFAIKHIFFNQMIFGLKFWWI